MTQPNLTVGDSDDVMLMLDMSCLWQDGTFYWDRGDGQNTPIQELSEQQLWSNHVHLHRMLAGAKDDYDEAKDTLEVFPDGTRAAWLNFMEQVMLIIGEFNKEIARRGLVAV